MADALAIGGASWQQQAGPLVFAPSEPNNEYVPADRRWILNFRLQGLSALIGPSRRAGIKVEARAECEAEWGQLARGHDPQGNSVEAWQAPTA